MTPERPFISICVPTYNRTEYLPGALKNLVAQDYERYEILISDDTADDRVQKIAESFGSDKIRYIRNKPPLGLMPKLNDFLEKAKGDWIVICCDDDLLDPRFLSVLSRHIIDYPGATQVRTRYKLIDADGKFGRLDPVIPKVMDPFEFLSRVFMTNRNVFTVNISGVLFPRTLLKEMGGFREFYKGLHADRLAWTQLGASGLCIFEEEPLCSIRIHENSVSFAVEADHAEKIQAQIEMKAVTKKLLDSMQPRARSDRDVKLLHDARRHAAHFIERCTQSCMDRGFLSILEEKKNVGAKTRGLFGRFKELGVPVFRSARAYFVLGHLPRFARRPFVEYIKKQKPKSLQNYLKEKN